MKFIGSLGRHDHGRRKARADRTHEPDCSIRHPSKRPALLFGDDDLCVGDSGRTRSLARVRAQHRWWG